MQYFRENQDQLLVLDLDEGDAWQKICSFLHIPVPDFPFPHVNKGSYTLPGRIYRYIRKRLKARMRDISRFFSMKGRGIW
jgi:hypothetical protein